MNLIVKTKYTLSTEFVLAQVRGNNHWRTSQVRLEILNDRTLNYVNDGGDDDNDAGRIITMIMVPHLSCCLFHP